MLIVIYLNYFAKTESSKYCGTWAADNDIFSSLLNLLEATTMLLLCVSLSFSLPFLLREANIQACSITGNMKFRKCAKNDFPKNITPLNKHYRITICIVSSSMQFL